MTAPLRDITILDLSRMYPGAFCTQVLADLGAQVVKVEAPRIGDGLRVLAPPGAFNAAHTALNRGKRSIVLDIRHTAASAVVRRLVRWADVVIESNRPGQLDQLGIGYDAMRVENPALVWASVTGFGSTGPNAHAPGHDITYLGSSGLLGKLADGPASPPGVALSLPLGASLAAVGILATLLDAVRSGTGRRLEVSLTEAATWTLAEDVAREANAPAPGWGSAAGRNVYTCADGRQVTVAATEPKTWAALCRALDLPDLIEHRIGLDDEEPVIARLTAAFASEASDHWLEHPGLAGGVGPVNDVADLLHDPQVADRGAIVAIEGSGAAVLASPIRIDDLNGDQSTLARRDPPDLGADTDAVLASAGFTSDEIADLRATQVVGGGEGS